MTAKEYVQRLLVCAQKAKSNALEFIENDLGVEKGDLQAEKIYKLVFPNDKSTIDALIIYSGKEKLSFTDVMNATYLANKDVAINFMYWVYYNEDIPDLEKVRKIFPDLSMI